MAYKSPFSEKEQEGLRILGFLVLLVGFVGGVGLAIGEDLGLTETPQEKRRAEQNECRAHGGTPDGVRCVVRYGGITYDLPMKDGKFDAEQARWIREICDGRRRESRDPSYWRFHPDTGVCSSQAD